MRNPSLVFSLTPPVEEAAPPASAPVAPWTLRASHLFLPAASTASVPPGGNAAHKHLTMESCNNSPTQCRWQAAVAHAARHRNAARCKPAIEVHLNVNGPIHGEERLNERLRDAQGGKCPSTVRPLRAGEGRGHIEKDNCGLNLVVMGVARDNALELHHFGEEVPPTNQSPLRRVHNGRGHALQHSVDEQHDRFVSCVPQRQWA